jgi:hypothetical protein
LTALQSNSSRNGTPAGVVGRMKMMVISATHTTANGFIHLYLLPSVHGPASNLSPIRQRR